MNAKKFSEAMGEIDGKYLDEAIQYKKKATKFRWVKWGAMAACLCLVLSGVFLYQAENRYPVKELPGAAGKPPETEELPRWEELEIYGQYDKIALGGLEYQAGWGVVPKEQLGAKLGDVTAAGWDNYAERAGEDANRYRGAAVYEIENISVQCAIAVQYEGMDTFYSAVNPSYRPDTLGDFIEDLDLQNTLVINWASYDYHKPIGGLAGIRFENLDPNRVWELLLSNPSAVNEYDDLDPGQPKEILGLSVSVPLLGYENISISIRESGFVMTNILSTGKLFHIGEESTQAFVDYVLRECDGYEIVYKSDPNAEITPE